MRHQLYNHYKNYKRYNRYMKFRLEQRLMRHRPLRFLILVHHRMFNHKRMMRIRGRFIGWKRKLLLSPIALAAIAGIFLMQTKPIEAAWYSGAWNYRKVLVIDESKVSGSNALTNFPVLVSITDSNVAANAQADGDDILFTSTNGSTKLDHELVSYSSGTIQAWVEVPTLLGNKDTQIYMYYGNPNASAQENVNGTWNSNYGGVWHLDENPAGSAPAMSDSTSNAVNLNMNGSMTSGQSVTGKVGNAVNMDGSNDYFQNVSGKNDVFDAYTSGTMEAWVNWDNGAQSFEEIINYNNDCATGVEMAVSGTGDHEVWNNSWNAKSTISSPTGTWHYLAMYVDSAVGNRLFIDGAEISSPSYVSGSSSSTQFFSSLPVATTVMQIGNATGCTEWFDGRIDEARISSTARSADWIATTYNTINSPTTFFKTIGQQQEAEPVLFWKFDEGSGTTAQDTSVNNNDGTLGGSLGAANGGPTNIDNAGDPGAQPGFGQQIIRNSSGTLYSLFIDSGSLEIWKSSDGTSWSQQDSADAPSAQPSGGNSMAIDSHDILHILYASSTTASRYVAFDTTTDQYGTSEAVISAASAMAVYDITIDSSDVPHIVTVGTSSGTSSVFYRWRADDGSWSGATVESSVNSYGAVSITMNEDDRPEIAYISVTDADLTTAVGNQTYASSFTVQDVDTSVNNTSGTYAASITIDSSGNTWVAYVDSNNDITLVKHNDADAWSSWQTPTNSGADGNEPSITTNGTDIYVFYEGVTTNVDDVVYDKYTGSWAGPVVLQAGTYQDVKAKWRYFNNYDSTDVAQTQTNTYYFDGSDAGATDPNAAWSNDSSAFDGSISTNASTTTNGSTSSNYLMAEGTNAPSTGGTITSVKLRCYCYSSDLSGYQEATVYTDGLGESLGSAQNDSGSASWSPYTTLSTPSGGWTWAKVQALEVKTYQFRLGIGTGRTYRIEVNVQSTNSASPTEIDYVYSDNTDIYWASLGNGATPGTPTFQAENQCIAGKCLGFTSHGVVRSYSSDSELDPGATSFSVSSWFKHSSTAPSGGTTDTLLARADGVNGVGYKIYMNSSGQLCFGIDASAGSFPNDSTCSTSSYADSTWHFAEAVKSGTSSITLYIDGLQVGTPDSSITASSISGTSSPFVAGIDVDGSSSPWDGFIDEVKVFSFAKSAAQVKPDFATKGSVKGAAAVGGDAGADFATKGLVAYWKMDETAANSCTGGTNDNCDSSGNAINGAWNGNATTTAAGKYGNGTTYDGTNDYTDMGNPSALQITGAITMSAWVNPSNTGTFEYIAGRLALGQVNYFLYKNTDNTFGFSINDTDFVDGTTTFSSGNWYYLVGSYIPGKSVKLYVNGVLQGEDTSGVPSSINNNAQNFTIASSADGNFDFTGKIDEVRVYNRALTNSEARQLYENGPGPVANWKMDEHTGTTLQDSSGNANTSSTFSGDASFVPGKYGSALTFDGVNDVVRIPEATVTDLGGTTDSYTLEAWVKFTTDFAGDVAVVAKDNATGTYSEIVINPSEQGCFGIGQSTNFPTACSTNSLNDNKWHHLVGVRDVPTDKIYMYVDGHLDSSSTDTTTATVANNDDWSIGNAGASYTQYDFTGQIDDVKIYNYSRTAKQVTSDMNGGHPAVGSPVASAIAHWKFDEGYGTTANNAGSAGSLVNGTLTNMATGSLASGWTNVGKLGKAIGFDGNNDSIDAGTNGVLNNTTNTMSISFWAQKAVTTEEGYIVARGTSGVSGYGVGFGNVASSGCASTQITASKFGVIHECIGSVPADTLWHHYTVVWDGSGSRAYLDGKLSSGTGSNTTNFVTSSNNFRIGTHPGAVQDFFKGTLDEVKVYNSALSADEVKVEYNQGKSMTLGSASINADGTTASNSAQRAYCPPGNSESNCAAGSDPSPIGEWKLDERTGTTANDTSGNGKSGSFVGSPQWSPGKNGGALRFDGDTSTTAVDMGDQSLYEFAGTTDKFTISAWIKLTATPSVEGEIVSKFNTDTNEREYNFGVNPSNQLFLWLGEDGGGANRRRETSNTALTLNQWTHVAMTIDLNSDDYKLYQNGQEVATTDTGSAISTLFAGAAHFYIGASYDNTPPVLSFPGLIDQVRIYNYALTPTQVAWDYNRGGPVGWWKFDECSGTTAYDASGNGKNGTINPGASGNTSAGTCSSGTSTHMWNDGTTGKFNSSLGFDNNDDYVNVPTPSLPTADFSYSFWIYWLGGSSDSVIGVSDGSGGDELAFRKDSTNTIEIKTNNSVRFNSSTVLSTNTWYHFVITRSGSTITAYLNGKTDGTGTDGTAFNFSSCDLLIGVENNTSGCTGSLTNWFDGQIDDVRVYNYPLSAAQVKTLYNENAAVRFGPSAGQP